MALELVDLTGEECFLCGHAIVRKEQRFTFGRPGFMAPELPMHRECFLVRPPEAVAILYHQRVADVVNIPRTNSLQRFFRRLLLGERIPRRA